MDGILQWVKNIAFFLILSGLVYQILPDSRFKKYVRFFMGLVLTLMVLSPLLNLWNLENVLVQAVETFSLDRSRLELQAELENGVGEQGAGIQREYQGMIQEKVTGIVAKKGYFVQDFSAELNLDPESEDVGKILMMEVILSPEDQDTVIWIEPVAIGAPGEGEPSSLELPEIRQEIEAYFELEEGVLTLYLKE